VKIITADEYLTRYGGRGAALRTEAYGQNGEPFWFYRIDNAALFGRYPTCLPYHDGGYGALVLDESDNYNGTQKVLAYNVATSANGDCVPILARADNCALLFQHWTDRFWHWITEALPKVIVLEDNGFTGNYIVPAKNDFVAQSMAMLGIAPDRLVCYSPNMAVTNLVITQKLMGVYNLKAYPGLMVALRRRLLAGSGAGKDPGGHDRVYIRRTHRRKIVNEEALQALLQRFGFHTLVAEQLPLDQQIRAMAGARCLVSPHGAGVLHCIFMPEGSTIVEMFNPNYINPVMLPFIRLLRHHYHMVPSLKIVTPSAQDPGNPVTPDDDIEAFLEVVETVLTTALEPRQPDVPSL